MKPFLTRIGLLIPVLAGSSCPVYAQMTMPAALDARQQPSVALSADFTVASSSNKPDGAFNQRQSGKYYRSADGKSRRDSAFGSVIADSKARTIIYLNHERRTATVIHLPAQSPPPAPAPSGGQGQSPVVTDLGVGIVDGREVTRRRVAGAFGEQEIWTATAINLPIFLKQVTPSGTSTQEFKNIRLGEPDPSLFTIPEGYAIEEKVSTIGSQSFAQTAPAP